MLYIVLVYVVVTIAIVWLFDIVLVVRFEGSSVGCCVRVNVGILLVIIITLAIATLIHTVL
jgi:hypothetical protein